MKRMSDYLHRGETAAQPKERAEELHGSLAHDTNAIQVAVEQFVHRILDIEDCLRFLPNVRNQQQVEEDSFWEGIRELNESLDDAIAKIGVTGKLDGYIFKNLIKIKSKSDRFKKARPDRVMAFSLFLGLFASFEAYLGDLLTAIFYSRPELFNMIGKDVPFKEVVSAKSIADIKSRVLTDYVEKFRRDSYIDQFDNMEKLFSIRLKNFSRWPDFVEVSQRRNVIAHCDGVVSQQYLENCRRAGCSIPVTVIPGSLLEISDEYLRASCRLVLEVGVKLGHTLWRKLLPEDLHRADSHLHNLIDYALYREEWSWAAVLSEFAIGQRNFSDELAERWAIVNYAIAIRYRDNADAAREIMARKDWSASAAELRLADAILRDDEPGAAKIMREIGRTGNFVGGGCYEVWPLFREFRTTKTFLDTYREIYGDDVINDLQQWVVQKQEEVASSVPTPNTAVSPNAKHLR